MEETLIHRAEQLYVTGRQEFIDSFGPSPPTETMIGGIACRDPVSGEHPASELIAEAAAEEKLRERFANERLPFEAIIPFNLSESLRKELGLYDLLHLRVEKGIAWALVYMGPPNAQEQGMYADGPLLMWFFSQTVLTVGAYAYLGLTVLGIVLAALAFVAISQAARCNDAGNRVGALSWRIVCLLAAPVLTVCFWGSEEWQGRQNSVKRKCLPLRTNAPYIGLTPEERTAAHVGELPVVAAAAPPEVQARLHLWHNAGYIVHLKVQENGFGIGTAKWLANRDPMPFVRVIQDGRTFDVIIGQYGSWLMRFERAFMAAAKRYVSLLSKQHKIVMN